MTDETWAVVTGAANGIGRAITMQLVSKGIRVLAIDKDSTSLASLKENLDNSDYIRTFHTDLKDLNDETLDAIDNLLENGIVKYVVQNAAYTNISVFGEITRDAASEAFAVNVITPLLLTQHFAASLHRSKGRVLHIGNAYAHSVSEGIGLYITSRCAFYKLYKQIKEEWKNKEANIGGVIFGATDTAALQRAWVEGKRLGLPVASDIEKWMEYNGNLFCPSTVAEKIVKVLMEYSDEDFSQEEIRIQ